MSVPRDLTVSGSLDRAIAIAVEAHAGAVDKAGAPYVLHPLRVMAAVAGELAKTVAVLHDVVEDVPGWTFKRLQEEGFGPEVIQALRSVTKTESDHFEAEDIEQTKLEKYTRFVRRAATHPVGRMVKLADINDNLDITRLKQVSEADRLRMNRYLTARALLLSA